MIHYTFRFNGGIFIIGGDGEIIAEEENMQNNYGFLI